MIARGWWPPQRSIAARPAPTTPWPAALARVVALLGVVIAAAGLRIEGSESMGFENRLRVCRR